MASITIGPEFDLVDIANRAGQSDPEKRFYRDGRLFVTGITQKALDAASETKTIAQPPIDPHAELVAAIANAIKDEPPGSPVRKLGEALLGQTSAGRVAGRPV